MKYLNKSSKSRFHGKADVRTKFVSNNKLQIEGRNPILEYLRNKPQDIQSVYVQKDINKDEKITELYELCGRNKVELKEVDRSMLDRMSDTETHQGVIGTLRNFSYLKVRDLITKVDNSNREPFFLIIRENLYEHNLGAILRTAASSGVNGVIVTPKSEITANVIRTSMGATATLDIAKASLFDALREMNENNIKIIAIEITGDKYYYDIDLTGPLAFIIGGEDHGISQEILEKCQDCVRIPMLGKVNSLNMSVAAGIVLYDKLRQEAST